MFRSILRSSPAGSRSSWWELSPVLCHMEHGIDVLCCFRCGVHLTFFFISFPVPACSTSSIPREGVKAASQPPCTQQQSWSFGDAGQWALGHGAPGKPSSSLLRPRAAQTLPDTQHSLTAVPSDVKYTHIYCPAKK